MRKMIYLSLSLLIVCFIFGNSMMDAVDSNSESKIITAFVQYVLNCLGFHMPIAELHHVIRKCAHFSEFALESFLWAKALAAFGIRRPTWLAYALLIGLLTAVIDENIQLYSVGRSGQVTDILLDFSGTMTGALMAIITSFRREK